VRLLFAVAGEEDIERFGGTDRNRKTARDQQGDHSSSPHETSERERAGGRCTERGWLDVEYPMRPGTEAEAPIGGGGRLLEVLDVTRSKQEEALIGVVFLELLGLDATRLNEVPDRLFALADKEGGLRGQDPFRQVPRSVSLAHSATPHVRGRTSLIDRGIPALEWRL
jgi:hypothetical protein